MLSARSAPMPGGVTAFGRCIGHDGMPVHLPPAAPLHDYAVEFVDARFYPNDENLRVGFNGFAEMTLRGNELRLDYVDLWGTRSTKSGQSTRGGWRASKGRSRQMQDSPSAADPRTRQKADERGSAGGSGRPRGRQRYCQRHPWSVARQYCAERDPGPKSLRRTVRQLDDALVKSASATHGALQQLAARGRTSPTTISRRRWSACGSWKKTMWLPRIDLLKR
jgi:hypothetical protein